MKLDLNSTFKTTIINTWHSQGAQWLNQLPDLIEKIKTEWQLTNIQPVDNMSYHFVATALQNNQPVVIKMGCDAKTYQSEKSALKHFAGQGSIDLIDANENYQALLLERAQPGVTLKDVHIPIEAKIDAYATVVAQLSSIPLIENHVMNCQQWCAAIDRIQDSRIKPEYIKAAQQLREHLLGSMQSCYVCHGDLHFENILQQGESWVSIDPHGVIGEKAFEVSAFDLIQPDEAPGVELMEARLTMLAKAAGVSFERLVAWVFLRCVVSAQWFIEDGGDPARRLRDIEILYLLIR